MGIKLLKKLIIFILVFIPLMSSCGGGIKGEYVAPNVLVNFKSGGIVDINGTSYPFEIKGKAVTVKEGNGKEEIFIILDNGNLQLDSPMGVIIFKKK